MKIISLNIETNKHFNKRKKKLIDEKDDIIYFQEILEEDIAEIYKTIKNEIFLFCSDDL